MLGELGQLIRAIAGGPSPTVIPTPSEVIPTLGLLHEPSFEFPRGSYMYEGYGTEGAGAGARSHVGLYNPKSSGVVAIVSFMMGHTTTSTVLMTVGTNAQGALMDSDGAEHATDTRIRVGTYSLRANTCLIVTDTLAQIGNTVLRIDPVMQDAGANYFYQHPSKFVLFPGAVLNVLPTSDNVSLTWSYRWSERRYDQEELRGCRPDIFA